MTMAAGMGQWRCFTCWASRKSPSKPSAYLMAKRTRMCIYSIWDACWIIFGIQDIPLGPGRMALANGTAFPGWLRQLSDNFWDFPLPDTDKTYPTKNAPELLVETIKESPEPVVIFLSGPFTNLAQALRLDPGIAENIATVYFMGGAVDVPGNITNLIPDSGNKVSEWNIIADPQAAQEVFDSGLDLYMVPLDATNQVILNRMTYSHGTREMKKPIFLPTCMI